MRANQIQASVPAPVASLPPREPMPSVHFSMARTVHFSKAIDTRRNGERFRRKRPHPLRLGPCPEPLPRILVPFVPSAEPAPWPRPPCRRSLHSVGDRDGAQPPARPDARVYSE